MVGLSLGEQNFIKGGIDQDLRTDGRKRLSYRPIFVETGVIPQVYEVGIRRCFFCKFSRIFAYWYTYVMGLNRQVAQQE